MTEDMDEPRSRVTLHVGMPKAGSSAIQRWIAMNTRELEQHGVTAVVARYGEESEPRLCVKRVESGNANSSPIISPLLDAQLKREVASTLADQVSRLADEYGHVVLSGESLCWPFWQHDPVVLDELNRIGDGRDCRVIYYVRPQHDALEACWCQWGFRSGSSPSEYITSRSRQMHYLDTHSSAKEVPNLYVYFRPYVRSHLVRSNIIHDFTVYGLGLPADVISDVPNDENVSAPIGVINLLATVPSGILWSSPHDNARFDRIKAIMSGHTIDDDDSVLRGRRILERWTFDRFHAENSILAGLMNWPNLPWPADDGGEERSLSELDACWTSSASPSELAVLHRLLEVCSEPTTAALQEAWVPPPPRDQSHRANS